MKTYDFIGLNSFLFHNYISWQKPDIISKTTLQNGYIHTKHCDIDFHIAKIDIFKKLTHHIPFLM